MIHLLMAILVAVSPDLDRLFESASKWRVGEAIEEVDSARKKLVELKKEALDYIFSEKIKTTSTLEYRAIKYVVKHLKDLSLPYIYAGIHDDNDTVKINCIRLLGDLKDTSSVDTLISLLKVEKKKKVIRSIIFALGEIGVSRAAKVIEPYVSSRDMRMRLVSVIALKKLKDEDSIECLFKALEDEYFIIRETALEALSLIGTEEVLGKALEKLDKGLFESYVGDAVEAAGTGLEMISNPGILGIGAIELSSKLLAHEAQKSFDHYKCSKRIKYIRLTGKVAARIKDKNRELYIRARKLLISYLYSPCYLSRGYAVRALKRLNDTDVNKLLELTKLKETNLFVRSQYSE